jgi:hypothetical protein
MAVSDRVRAGRGLAINDDGAGVGSVQQPGMEERKFMYVPPFDSLLQAIGMTRAEFATSRQITIPTELFKLLLQVTVANSDFNAAGYLKANPDVAEAIRKGSTEDARIHYVGFGFFESRAGATPEVDEGWYLRTYSDVAEGVKARQVSSAAEHFKVVGAAEGRSPSAAYSLAAEQWKKAIKGSQP